MAGLSGIVKKISDLVTGTPADDDCFIFGKTDLKKITLAKLKDALGITSINSALDKKQDSLKGGTYSGSLNTLKTPGIYWCNFAEVTGSIYSNGYGWVEVSTVSSDGSALQKVYRLGEGNIITQIIVRPFVNSQWYSWRVLQTSNIS